MVAAAPVTVLVGVVMVSTDLGPHAARELAMSTSAHVLAQVALAVAFFHVAGRHGTLTGLMAATGAYVGFAGLATLITPPVAVTLGLVSAIVGRNLLGDEESDPSGSNTEPVSGALVLLLRAGVALTAATGIFLTAHLVGPSLAGAVGAYPVFSVTLACLVASTRGMTGLRNVLRGLVRALPAYLAFGVTYWLTAPLLGEVGGISAATITCCLSYSALNRAGRVAGDGSTVPHDGASASPETRGEARTEERRPRPAGDQRDGTGVRAGRASILSAEDRGFEPLRAFTPNPLSNCGIRCSRGSVECS
jgi:uncharacterized membrane protein (GlpM family)